MKKSFVIHPFLFAIFPVLFLFVHNMDRLVPNVIVIPAVVTTCFAFLSWALLSFVLRDEKKAGLLTSLFLLMFFSYGHFYDYLLKDLYVKGFEIARPRYFLLVWCILFAYGVYLIVRTRRNLQYPTIILNYVAAVLISVSLINIVGCKTKTKVTWFDDRDRGARIVNANTTNLGKAATPPDIYYIVFDRYASSSTLKEFYNYDNSEFTDYLTSKGFYVAAESRCNYLGSEFSLASSLNMEYLGCLSNKLGEKMTDRTPVYWMLQDYKVWRFLKSKGYKFVHFGSWWSGTARNKYADININYGIYKILDRFSVELFKTTMIYPLYIDFVFGDKEENRRRVLNEFNELAEMPKAKGPKFVFAHMLIPHEPFVFNRNGNLYTTEEDRERSEGEKYLNQLIFLNAKIKPLINRILSTSDPSPIIILQADEGPKTAGINKGGKQDRKGSQLRKDVRILNAYYLPNADKSVLYPSITPVNSFRQVFNLYFNTHFKLLPDESYVSMDGDHPYKFLRVTNKVK